MFHVFHNFTTSSARILRALQHFLEKYDLCSPVGQAFPEMVQNNVQCTFARFSYPVVTSIMNAYVLLKCFKCFFQYIGVLIVSEHTFGFLQCWQSLLVSCATLHYYFICLKPVMDYSSNDLLYTAQLM